MNHHRARSLRKFSTDAERRLWSGLRARRLLGYRFRRQHQIGPYYADFVCCELKLIVEADGSQHYEDVQLCYDYRRTKCLETLGYTVIRLDNVDILKRPSSCLDFIAETLKMLAAKRE